jgi:hypothetical protein
MPTLIRTAPQYTLESVVADPHHVDADPTESADFR